MSLLVALLWEEKQGQVLCPINLILVTSETVNLSPCPFRKFSDFIYAEDNKNFDTIKLGKYKAGDIIYAEFGYNVGSEYGGRHYAIVIENSPLKADMIMVVPLSSLPASKTEEDVHRNDAYLGELPKLNKIAHSMEGTRSIAIVNQTRAIAKQRIVAPVNKFHERIFIDGPLLGLIYGKLKTRYTTQGVKRENKREKDE